VLTLGGMNRTSSPQSAAHRPFARLVRSVRRALERATADDALQRIPTVRRYPY
jgi:hypothetical protein